MKRNIFLIKALVLAVILSTVVKGQDSKWLWPVKGAAAGDKILFRPQDYIGEELNFGELFVGAKEGAEIVAPVDGVISQIGYCYNMNLVNLMSWPIVYEGNEDIEQFDKAQKIDMAKGLIKKLGRQINYSVSPRNFNISILISVRAGENLYISGLTPIKFFKTGSKIKKGEIIGKMGYGYRLITEPSIMIGRSIKTKTADPMAPFGITSTFIAPKKDNINYLKYLHPVDKLKEDFAVLKEALEDGHPGIYDYTPKEKMDSLFNDIQNKINKPMASEDFRRLIYPVVANIRDSHTILEPVKYSYPPILLPPVLFGPEEGVLKIGAAKPAFSQYVGLTIVEINGVKAEELIKQISKIPLGTEGFIESCRDYRLLGNFWNFYYRISYPINKNKLDLVFSNGKTLKTSYSSLAKGDRFEPMLMLASPRNGSFETKKLNNKTAALDLNSFMLNQSDLDSIGNFIKEMGKSGCINLIIDIRDNPGGYEEVVRRLFSFFADEPFKLSVSSSVRQNKSYSFLDHCNNLSPSLPPIFPEYIQKEGKPGYYLPDSSFIVTKPDPDIHFKGNLYLLTNENSYSASTLFASLIHKYKKGVIVGRETGSSYYQMVADKFANVNLNNSGLELRLPLVKGVFETTLDPKIPWGRGVLPDYPLGITFAEMRASSEIASKDDKIFSYVLSLIDNQTKQ